jgi:hypothetical protein
MESIPTTEEKLRLLYLFLFYVPRDLGDTSRHVERSARQDSPRSAKTVYRKFKTNTTRNETAATAAVTTNGVSIRPCIARGRGVWKQKRIFLQISCHTPSVVSATVAAVGVSSHGL